VKAYLGDSVYAEYRNNGIWLTVEDGLEVSQEIRLEPETMQNLTEFVLSIAQRQR
jgi:hypothetical protein